MSWFVDKFSLGNKAESFKGLTEKPAYEKVILAKLQPARDISSELTLLGGSSNTYQMTWTEATQGSPPNRVDVNGVRGEEFGSVGVIDDAENRWFFDYETSVLSVHLTDVNSTTLCFFWLNFSNIGGFYEEYHDPLLVGMFGTGIESNEVFWGISPANTGSLRFANHLQYWDTIWDTYIWVDKSVKILLGSNQVSLAQYKQIFTGLIKDKAHTRTVVAFAVTDEKDALKENVLLETYQKTEFPNLPDSNVGANKAIFFGNLRAERGIPAVCIDPIFSSQAGDSSLRYSLGASSNFPLISFVSSECEYWDGGNWRPLPIKSSNVADGTFRTDFLDSSDVTKDTPVRISVVGKLASAGGSKMDKGPHIIEDLIVTTLGRGELLDSASIATAKVDSDMSLAIHIEDSNVTYNDLIQAVAQSEMGLWFTDGDGEFNYRVWQPSIQTTPVTFENEDYIRFGSKVVQDQIVRYTRIGYAKRWTGEKTTQYAPGSPPDDDMAKWKYGATEPRQIETLLQASSDAEVMRQRYDLITMTPTKVIEFNTKWRPVFYEPFDKIVINRSRGPGISGTINAEVYEITRIKLDGLNATVVATDLKGVGVNAGMWTSANAPDYGAATPGQKATQGFWTDSSGFADPSDPGSKNVSRWW